jgi:hypothetical protein
MGTKKVLDKVKPVKYVKPVLKGMEIMQKGYDMQVKNDPYYQHMPKNNEIDAIKYSTQMGGEHNDITCEIF